MPLRITIEQLDEGYLLTLSDGKKIAVTNIDTAIIKIKAFFGKTDKKQTDKKQTDKMEMQPTDIMIEHPTVAPAVEGKQVLPSISAHTQIISPSDLKLPKFECEFAMMKPYKNIFFLEMPDGKVCLEYAGSHYYTTKDLVLKIPYPFPKKYFRNENGWSSTVEVAFKKYRQYLAELPQRQQVEKEKPAPESTDDWKYKSFGLNNTRIERENYTKIEGTLEA